MGYNAPTNTYDTFYDLRQATGQSSSSVTTLGSEIINDGLGGKFYWDNGSSLSDDNKNIIRPLNLPIGRWVRLSEEVKTREVIVSTEAQAKYFTITMRRAGDVTPPLNVTGLSYSLNDQPYITVPFVNDSYWTAGNSPEPFPNWARSQNLIPFNGESIKVQIDSTTDDYIISLGFLDESQIFLRREFWYPETFTFNELKRYNNLDDVFSEETEENLIINVEQGKYRSIDPLWQMKNGWVMKGAGAGCVEIITEYTYASTLGLYAQANCKIQDLTLTVIANNNPTDTFNAYAIHIDQSGTYTAEFERINFKTYLKYDQITSTNNNICLLLGIGTWDKQTLSFKDCNFEAQTLNKGNRNIANTHNQVGATIEKNPANLIFDNCNFVGGFASLLIADVNIFDENDNIRAKTKYSILNSTIPSIKFKSFDPFTLLPDRKNGFTFNASGSHIGEYINPEQLVNPRLQNYDSTSLPMTKDVDYMYVFASDDTESAPIPLTFDEFWGADNTFASNTGWARSTNLITKTSIQQFSIQVETTVPDVIVAINFLNANGTAYYREAWGANNTYVFSNPTTNTQFGITLRSESGTLLTSANVTGVNILYLTEGVTNNPFVQGSYYSTDGSVQTIGGEYFARLTSFIYLNGEPFKLNANEQIYGDFEFAVFYTDDANTEISNERYGNRDYVFTPPAGATRAYINFKRRGPDLVWNSSNVTSIGFKTVEQLEVGQLMTYVYGDRKAHWYIDEELVRSVPIGITKYKVENAGKFAGVILANGVSDRALHFKKKGIVSTNTDLSALNIGDSLPNLPRVYVARKNVNENIIDII